MRCGSRALSLTSLGFGLVATGALSLAVATDYWLFTVEPVIPNPEDMTLSNETAEMMAAYERQEVVADASEPPPAPILPAFVVISMHSGLWRLCIINDPPGACIALYL